MGYHDQGRPGTDLRTASLLPRTMEKGLGDVVRDVVTTVGDAGSTRPG